MARWKRNAEGDEMPQAGFLQRWFSAPLLAVLTSLAATPGFAQYKVSVLATSGSVASFDGFGVAVDIFGHVYATGIYPNSANFSAVFEIAGNPQVIKPVAGASVTIPGFTWSPTGSPPCSATPGAFGFDIDNIIGVAFKRGNLYVAEGGGAPGVIRVDKGTASAVPGSANCDSSAIAVAADILGNVYFSAPINEGFVYEVTSAGEMVMLAQGGSTPCNAQIGKILGVAAHYKGKVYAADEYCNVIWEISSPGSLRAVAGIPGNSNIGCGPEGVPATSSNLGAPTGVAVDLEGNIYIVDTSCARIRKVTAKTGLIETIAGSPVSAPLSGPYGIATSLFGKVFVAQSTNHLNGEILELTPQ